MLGLDHGPGEMLIIMLKLFVVGLGFSQPVRAFYATVYKILEWLCNGFWVLIIFMCVFVYYGLGEVFNGWVY